MWQEDCEQNVVHMMINFTFGEEMKNDVINMRPSTGQKKNLSRGQELNL